MRKVLLIVVAVLMVALVAGGSFWGGIKFQENKAAQAQANFFNTRGGQLTPGGQFPGDGQQNGGQVPGGGMGFPGGRGTAGEVKTIAGDVLTLSTAQDVTTVNLSDATLIQKTVSGTTSDLQPGTRVMVTGETDADGNIAASQITVLDNIPPVMMNPSATGTAP